MELKIDVTDHCDRLVDCCCNSIAWALSMLCLKYSFKHLSIDVYVNLTTECTVVNGPPMIHLPPVELMLVSTNLGIIYIVLTNVCTYD